ncbi:MAG: metallophosphoesterase family protein [Dehalococcoidia bacterium]|nr:metallophosphoesterase family protein [Dehalococcoidia bacterium]
MSDIHGNLTALKAVIADLRDKGPVDEYWCMGDIVGYGPAPNECVELLKQLDLRCVLGNHDAAAAGLLDLADFNLAAKDAIKWTMDQLSEDNRQFLASLPMHCSEGDYTLVHGSPLDPTWDYISSAAKAKTSLSYLQTLHGLVGHTHVPVLYVYVPENKTCVVSATPAGQPVQIARQGRRILFNPGSVGQPRDGDPRASYALLDVTASTITHHRVPYDVEAVQRAMRALGLPTSLAERLSHGW